ncbi:uncharacterized protein LOC110096713 isoform X2 [Dendrobium catenatum]|uniref:uncharacterized protein LOC110096713 isoform X2 n=1 Tax=Dendrobium catenatum TaxID=906689 RepID=UPI0009F432A0|nr:uncharacterized protein LOC110096713 isoform X2 [Dendrobium catenatum]
MSPKDKLQRSAGELEEDTCTRRKKSRRVSFAETTVHVFKRDDESESPANSTPAPSEGFGHSDSEGTVGFRGLQSQGDDSVESAPDDEGKNGARFRFVRDIDLSSPGSAVGSVTSNEDDNFFGPVSTSFINSGHLSESGMPDDNSHDITLDSTAFSLHFRNIAPPDDQSVNSAGSLRTPIGDTMPTMPLGFFVGSDQTEKLSSKCSVGEKSNVSGDRNNINLNIGGFRSHEYGKLSHSLEALMDEVNLRVQQKSPIGDCRFIISSSQTDKVGGIRKLWKDGEEVGNQNSCCDEPGHVIPCSVSPMGLPISNESLLHAKDKALASHSNSEQIKEMFSPVSVDRVGKGYEAVHPEVIIANGDNSKLLSLSPGKLQNDLNGQGCRVNKESFRCTTSEGKSHPDSNLHSISSVLSISDDVKQKLDSVSIAHTPKNATKLFHTSALQEITPSSHGWEQQHFLSQTVPPSSKFLAMPAREKLAFRMQTPVNAVKAFQFSSFKGSTSSFKVGQLQTLNFSPLSQSELMHDAARQQSDYLRWELMGRGESISASKNHITTSNVKSRMQSDYGPAPSCNDLFVTAFQSTPNDICDDHNMKLAGVSDVNLGTTKVNAAEQMEGMNIVRDVNCPGNISCLTKPEENSALESMSITMETPDNAVKTCPFSTLKSSISSYQDKQRKLQYRSVMSQGESLHSPARELSASLKMELKVHDERISAIKTSITRSGFKSKVQTDCEAAPLIKDLFITNLQCYLNEIDPYKKHVGASDVNGDPNGLTAVEQMEGLDIVKDLNNSSSCLTGLNKNVAFMETVERDQSEKCIEFFCDSSLKLPYTLGQSPSSIDQIEADLKESNKDISRKYALPNKEKATISLKGHFTSGVDETSSSDLLERKSLQPAACLVSPSVEKLSNGKILNLPVSSGTSVHYGKTGIDSRSFHVGGLYYNKNLNENSANRPNKVIERPMSDPSKAPGVVLEANTTLNKSLEDTEFQQGTNCRCDIAVVGEIGNKQTCHTENAGYSESYRMQNSPVNVPNVVGDSLILLADHMHHDEALDIAGKATLKCWTDVFSKLSDSTNHLLPQSISELNLQKLDDMENFLDELQTARNYEGLCITLRNKECYGHPHQKRVIDARFLLEKLGIAKARKQLKCMKLKKIRDKAQILQSQVEEFDKLKSNYAQTRDLCTRVVESDESSYYKNKMHEMKPEEQNRLMAMKQELGILEQNIKLLLKSFEASCKLTWKMSCNDIIKAVDEQVMRRQFCKEIQRHCRLWSLHDVVMVNGHYEITLGYCNLLFQRFTLNNSRFSSIVANIFSDAANIIKKYPNMNACIAFEFVFKLNVDQKFAGSNCIYERIVETNLLMGTLIVVLEEILLSRLELLNLIFSTFLKQSCELELQLCFYSSSCGRKLIMAIDMSSLNCWIYPSDPSELKIKVCEPQTTLPSSIVNKAIGAVRSLECGHLMILRLCRSVSQVIQFST